MANVDEVGDGEVGGVGDFGYSELVQCVRRSILLWGSHVWVRRNDF